MDGLVDCIPGKIYVAVRGLLGGGSVIARQMRAFAVANEMSRVEVTVSASAAFASSSAASLPCMPV